MIDLEQQKSDWNVNVNHFDAVTLQKLIEL